MSAANAKLPPGNAVAYVRMSTEHQQYSTSNQMDVVREYAKRRGFEIVKIYSDEGKSGLNIQGRDSLAQMIKDVQSGESIFPLFWFMMSADGDGSRTRTKAPITNTSAAGLVFRSIIARSNLKMTAARCPRS